MKKIVLLLLCLLLALTGVAETMDEIIPDETLWGAPRQDVEMELDPAEYESCAVGDRQALKITGIDVDGYSMDAYYVFGENMWDEEGWNYMGLSKVAYLLTGEEGLTPEQLNEKKSDLVERMEEALRAADQSEDAVSVWNEESYKIEIGWGKFENYTGSTEATVGIVFSALNVEKPVTPSPSPIPTPVPTLNPEEEFESEDEEAEMEVYTE